MNRRKIDTIFGSVIIGILLLLVITIFWSMVQYAHSESSNQKTSASSTQQTVSSKPKPRNKTQEEKQAVMEQDATTMDSYGLHYDYANLSLQDVIKEYMKENGIADDQVAFSYKDITTGETASMNDTQPMTAGSTYKLPLNMLVVDEVDKGKYNLTQRFDITNTEYENLDEHNSYVAAFNGAMSITDMQRYSLVYSENTPAYALSERLGGMEKAYSMFGRYGQSKGEIKTIREEGNKVTTDYYIQVLDYLYKHSEKYADLIQFLKEAFPDDYYHRYCDVTVAQKPGYVREALNVGAVVYETKPYLIALYTKGLGGSTEESSEINGTGYIQLCQLCYVVNEWHRVNMN